jgi:hypothetical protein
MILYATYAAPTIAPMKRSPRLDRAEHQYRKNGLSARNSRVGHEVKHGGRKAVRAEELTRAACASTIYLPMTRVSDWIYSVAA